MGLRQTEMGLRQTDMGLGLTEDDYCPRKRLCDTSGVCQMSADSHVTEDDNSVKAVDAGENCLTTSATHLPTEKGAYQDQRKLVQPVQSSVTVQTAQPCRAIPGHTGFLTFATLSAVVAAESSTS